MSSILTFLVIIVATISLFGILAVLFKVSRNPALLHEQWYIDKYSYLTKDLKLTGRLSFFWKPLTLLRWVVTLVILLVLRDYPEFQIVFLIFASFIFQMLLILIKPLIDNHIALFNEVMVSTYLYTLMLLTDMMGDNSHRDSIGLALTLIIVITVAVNLLKFLLCSLIEIKKKLCDKRAKA